MPIQRCERDGEQGWRWGESGKCYLANEEGSDDEAKRKAYLQGAAITAQTGEELMSSPGIIEFADIKSVPILKVGEWHPHNTDHPLPVIDIDSIIEGSNACQEIILEAMQTGKYRGNESLTLTKPIPAIMNIHHQELFPGTKVNDAIKEAFQGVSATYQKELIDGEEWLTANYHNVPNGSAETLRRHFPLRSVELLPLRDPNTGKNYPLTIRSTAFLSQTTKPAVSGQRPELIVEFQGDESPVVRLTSTFLDAKEPSAMATEQPKEEKKVDVDVAEFEQAKDALAHSADRIAELESKLAESAKAKETTEQEKAKTVAELQAANERRDAQIAEMAAKLDAKEVKELCHDLQMKPRVNVDNHAFILSKSAMDILTPGIRGKGVFELQQGEDARHAFVNRIDQLVELAAKGALLVPMTMQGHQTFDAPEQQNPTEESLVKEYMAADEKLTEEQAWIKAQAALKVYQRGVQ